MLLFWILAALMTLAALAFVLVPMLRARAAAGPSAHDAALEVLRGQRGEIESDVASGTLPVDAREEALAELVERADRDLEAAAAVKPATAAARKPWVAAAVVALAIPALAMGLYGAVGTPSASDPKTLAAASAPIGDAQIVAMVESLASKVRERPQDAKGWELLARSMAALGRFPESADAYEHVAKLVPASAQVFADWADALGMAQGRTLRGRPTELVKRALELDPNHQKALALAATAAMDAGDRAAAIGYWQRVAAQLPPGSPDAAQVASIIAEIRGSGGPVPPSVAAAPTPSATAGNTVSGTVVIAPSMAAQVKGDETVFVFARAEGGPRVPLAVYRANAKSLPLAFALDDTQAMAPGMNISSAQAVRVEARITRSGNATPQPGDLVGTSAVVKPGARDVKIVVDKVVP